MKKLFTLLATALLMVGTHTPAHAEPVSDAAIIVGLGLAFGVTVGPYIDKAADVFCEMSGIERGFAKPWLRDLGRKTSERTSEAAQKVARIAAPKINKYNKKELFRKLGINNPALTTAHTRPTRQFKLEGTLPARSFDRSRMSRQDMIDAAPALIAALPKLQTQIKVQQLLATGDLSTF